MKEVDIYNSLLNSKWFSMAKWHRIKLKDHLCYINWGFKVQLLGRTGLKFRQSRLLVYCSSRKAVKWISISLNCMSIVCKSSDEVLKSPILKNVPLPIRTLKISSFFLSMLSPCQWNVFCDFLAAWGVSEGLWPRENYPFLSWSKNRQPTVCRLHQSGDFFFFCNLLNSWRNTILSLNSLFNYSK